MEYLWDFIFGALLIGGAPMSVLGLFIVTGDLLQGYFHFNIPVAVGAAIAFLGLALAASGFAAALIFRFRRRLLPRGYLIGEVILGAFGGFFLFAFYGVIMHSIID